MVLCLVLVYYFVLEERALVAHINNFLPHVSNAGMLLLSLFVGRRGCLILILNPYPLQGVSGKKRKASWS